MKKVKHSPGVEKIMELPVSYEEKGKEIGKEIGKKEVASSLLKKDLSIEFIVEVTGLSAKEIEALKS